MKKFMSRYKGLILSCVSVMMIVVCVCSFSFESRASGDVFYLDYAEPATSESQGYLVVAIQNNSTSEIKIITFFWNSYAVDGGIESPAEMLLTITTSTINFNVQQYGATGVWYTVGAVTTVENYRIYAHTNNSDYTYDFGAEDYSIVGWKLKGNGSVSGFWNSYDFSVFFSDDGEAILLQEIINLLISSNSIDSSILGTVTSILNSVDGVESQLSSVVSYLSSVSSKLTTIQTQLNTLITRADELLAEQKESNSWLEKIWNSIQEFINPSEEDSAESEELENETTEKSETLDGLNEQNKTDKTDIDSASNSVDENVDLESIGTFNNIFVYITENEYILQMLLMVFSVALVAYVLFGKK